MIYGNLPFKEGAKETPILIDHSKAEFVIYPQHNLDYSDLCQMYVRNEEMTGCIMSIGPGGMFDPPDIHAGDETYYVLEGSITLLNPSIGQCVEVKEGQAVLIPKGALHTGYNFNDKTVKVLAIIASQSKGKPDVSKQENCYGKEFSQAGHGSLTPSFAFNFSQKVGTINDIGAWPQSAYAIRESGVIYPIEEKKKLRVIHGSTRPLLIKFAVSNDIYDVGEYILPIGGPVAAHSEPICHDGRTFLFAWGCDATVVLADSKGVYNLHSYDGIYLPSGTEYRLANYGSVMMKMIFAITKPSEGEGNK